MAEQRSPYLIENPDKKGSRMILITGASGQLASQIATGAKRLGLTAMTASRSPDADRRMDFDRPETLDFT
jgi:NAD(P)H dehydrogenase (quinone)